MSHEIDSRESLTSRFGSFIEIYLFNRVRPFIQYGRQRNLCTSISFLERGVTLFGRV